MLPESHGLHIPDILHGLSNQAMQDLNNQLAVYRAFNNRTATKPFFDKWPVSNARLVPPGLLSRPEPESTAKA